MFLEIITFAVLMLLLAVKYLTFTHISHLNRRRIELENICASLTRQHRDRKAQNQRSEASVKLTERECRTYQTQLEELQEELREQMERNEAMSQ